MRAWRVYLPLVLKERIDAELYRLPFVNSTEYARYTLLRQFEKDLESMREARAESQSPSVHSSEYTKPTPEPIPADEDERRINAFIKAIRDMRRGTPREQLPRLRDEVSKSVGVALKKKPFRDPKNRARLAAALREVLK